MENEIRKISEFKLHESLVKFLEVEGAVDNTDGEICGQVVSTRNTVEDFKSGCASFKGFESHEFGNQKLEILRNFQGRAGDNGAVANPPINLS